ncbi:MAG: ADOP family duplicated permease [Acidobacteriota bacterium]
MSWDEIRQDLDDLFQARVRERGRRYAHWRYVLDLISVWVHLFKSPQLVPDPPPRWWAGVARDAFYGLRILRARRGPTVVAVLGLAVAIGVGTSVFAVLNAVALRPLGVPHPDAVMRVWQKYDKGLANGWPFAEALGLREQSSRVPLEIFNDLNRVEFATNAGADHPARINGRLVGGGYFDLLQGSASFGRLLAAADDRPDAPPVVVVSYQFWERHLASDRSTIGRSIWLNGAPFTVVGVTGRSFSDEVDRRPALWVPIAAWSTIMSGSPPLDRASRTIVTVVARVPDGMTEAQAEAAVGGIAAGVAAGRPGGAPPAMSAHLVRLDDRGGGGPDAARFAAAIAVVVTVIGLILLLACANVANLLFASALTRHREIGVRLAMGATRARVIQQQLTESAMLGLAGGVLGLIVAAAGMPLFLVMIQAPLDLDVTFDYRVFLFLTFVSVAAGLGAGLSPARNGTRGDLLGPLKGDWSQAPGRQSGRARRGLLVGVQSAVSVLLLILAALLTRAAGTAANVDLGFDAERLVTTMLALDNHGYNAASATAFWDDALARLRGLPDIESAALATFPPLGNSAAVTIFRRHGREYVVYYNEVSADYFATLGLRVVRGRALTDQDVRGQAPVVVITEGLAREFWPGEDPIGQPFDRLIAETAPPTIIGIVSNAVTQRLFDPDRAAVYSPIQPKSLPAAALLTRARRNPEATIEPLRTVIRSVDADLRPTTTTMSQELERELNGPRAMASLAGSIGLIALVLALVGIYGVASFMVSQRVAEIGVRVAIGATAGDVLRLLIRDTLRPVAIGIVAGAIGAMLAGRVMAGALFGVQPHDPVAVLGAAGLLAITATLAAIVPARRAASADPATVLRS